MDRLRLWAWAFPSFAYLRVRCTALAENDFRGETRLQDVPAPVTDSLPVMSNPSLVRTYSCRVLAAKK